MSINIVEEVQKQLQLPPLQKVDANNDAELIEKAPYYPVSHTALVVSLVGLYNLTRTSAGCVKLLLKGKTNSWLKEAYGTHLEEAIHNAALCSGADDISTTAMVKHTADASIMVLHEQLHNNISVETVQRFMDDQRNNILVYVPEALHLGKMLNNAVLDDTTNKMQGPVSGLMHKIENVFSDNK